MTYLDHNATNLIDPRILARHIEVLREVPGNPGSPHSLGRAARAIVEAAREDVAAAFGFDRGGVTFTASGTEALNLLIRGLRPWAAGDHLLLSAIEHKAALEAAAALAESAGVLVETLPVTAAGTLDLSALPERLRPETRAVAVMAANNETGVRQPLAAIKAALPPGLPLLVDAVQAAGRVQEDWSVADGLVISGHKLRGPKGAAAALTRPGIELRALLRGGAQERGRRGGTEDVAAIAALGAAARLLSAGELLDPAALAAQREAFEAQLKAAVPRLVIHGEDAPRLPQTTNLRRDGRDAESLIALLDLQGIALSSGSACASGSLLPSHVLVAMGLSPAQARAALRISFGPETGEGALLAAADAIAAALS